MLLTTRLTNVGGRYPNRSLCRGANSSDLTAPGLPTTSRYACLIYCTIYVCVHVGRDSLPLADVYALGDVNTMLSTGILGGGAAGVREGFMKAPNRRSRVLLNSVMNHAGKKGSMYGNTLGVLGEVESVGIGKGGG